MMRLMWYSANLPGSPLRNTCGETMSSMPFLRKTSPSESWMPRTTGWVNSLASVSTIPVSANKSSNAPKMMPEAPITGSVIIAG